jgi:hypothetical protein
MSKKDYIAVAHAFSDAMEETNDDRALRVVANRLCGVFRRDNPRFDADRFLRACKLEG